MFLSMKDRYIFNIAQINFSFVDAIFILTFPHEYRKHSEKSDIHLISHIHHSTRVYIM